MKKITVSLPIVVVISLGIQVLGLIKSLLLASNLGANYRLDAFYLANVFTISIFSVVNSAITTVVIPSLNSNESLKVKNRVISNYISIVELFSIIFSTIFFVGVVLFRKQIAPNFSHSVQLIFILNTLILLISQQFRIRSGVSVSVFQSEGYYILPRFLDIIPAVLPVIFLVTKFGDNTILVALFIAIGYIVETFLLNFYQKKMDYRYRFKFNISFSNDVKRLLWNTIPVLISSAVFQLQVLLSNYFASNFGQGYVTFLSNTNQIMGIFQGLFVGNIINMLYPKLVKNLVNNFNQGLKQASNYITLTNLIVIILVWGYIAVGKDLVTFLFVHGKFTAENADIVYRYSVILGIALPFDVVRDYFYRIFYSVGNTRKPMVNSILTVVFNIILLIVGSKFVGPIILVLAPATGTILSLVTIFFRARKSRIVLSFKRILRGFVLSNFVGIIMTAVIRLVNFNSSVLLLKLLVEIMIGAFSVLIIGIVFLAIFKLVGREK